MPSHTVQERAKKNTHMGLSKGEVISAKMANIVSPPTPNRVMKSKKTTTDIR